MRFNHPVHGKDWTCIPIMMSDHLLKEEKNIKTGNPREIIVEFDP